MQGEVDKPRQSDCGESHGVEKLRLRLRIVPVTTIPNDAIRFFLGADVGGRGASMVVSEKPDISTWTVEKPDGTKITIQVNKKDANKY